MSDGIIQQIVNSVVSQLSQNVRFRKAVLSSIKLTQENIDASLLQFLKSQVNSNKMPLPPVQTNRPLTADERQQLEQQKKGKEKKFIPRPLPLVQGAIEAQIVSDLLSGNNVYLYGKAGTGKTYLAETIAMSVMEQPFYTINCSQWTSPVTIIGGQTIKGYEEGTLVKAWADGAILILDELPKLDPNTAGILNDALAKTASMPTFDDDGKEIEGTIPFITNGRGEKIYRGQNAKDPKKKYMFAVIGTGNTDMKSVKNNYSGNQRQDYSLVDRFAGSYYVLDYSLEKEKALTYPYVFNIAQRIREILNNRDAVESISLRTMLNFNRTYEQYMLSYLESPYANKIYDNNDRLVKPKTLTDSLDSFLRMLEPELMQEIMNDDLYKQAVASSEGESAAFKEAFHRKYGVYPSED